MSSSGTYKANEPGSGTSFAGTLVDSEKVPTWSEQPFTGGGQDAKNVTTAATPVQLSSSSVPCRAVWIKAKAANTGVIAWGWSSAVRASGTVKGDQLEPGEKVAVPVTDLSLIWIDAAVNGEGVTYTYGNAS